MAIDEKVSLTLSIKKEYRDRLRTMAAQQNLENPDQLTSASTIAREIVCEHIDNLKKLEEVSGKNSDETYSTPNKRNE